MTRVQTCTLALVITAIWLAGAPVVAEAQGIDPTMQHRFNALLNINFGDNANVIGTDLRYDHPVHEYVTAGAILGFFGSKVDAPGLDREPGIDLAAFVKGRYSFEIGKANPRSAEAYAIFHVGPTFAFGLNAAGRSDSFATGYNVGISPGWQVLITDRVGVLGELGFIHRQINAKDQFGKVKIKGSQGVLRVGVVVVLP